MKRIAAIAAVLLMLCGCARAAVSVRMDDGAALLSEDGAQIVPVGAHADIVPLGDDLFAAQDEAGGYALMDGEGRLLTGERYDALRRRDGLLLAQRDGGWGLLGADGAELSALAYGQIVPTGEGGCWATLGDASDLESDLLVLLDAQGRESSTGIYVRKLGAASEGLLSVLLPGTGLWGYCDARGRVAIAARYSYAGPFVSGCAAVVRNGRYGAIDATGAFVADPDYDFIEISKSGFMLAARSQEGAWALNMDGSEIAAYESEDCFVALAGEGYLVADSEGMRVFDATGAQIAEAGARASVSEGMNGQLILSDGMWGEECVGVLGTQARYQNLYPLGTARGEGVYACMQANAARYVNDLLGEIQLSVDMETARYGIVGADGVQRTPCAYLSIEFLADDRFLTRSEEGWQMIDADGAVYWTRAYEN